MSVFDEPKIESVWNAQKRNLHGVYRHASEKHLARHVSEFTFRLNDGEVKRHTLGPLAILVTVSFGQRFTYHQLSA